MFRKVEHSWRHHNSALAMDRRELAPAQLARNGYHTDLHTSGSASIVVRFYTQTTL